ncbi:hypothetical protein ARSEF1564_010279 [Beauveria bassiana]
MSLLLIRRAMFQPCGMRSDIVFATLREAHEGCGWEHHRWDSRAIVMSKLSWVRGSYAQILRTWTFPLAFRSFVFLSRLTVTFVIKNQSAESFGDIIMPIKWLSCLAPHKGKRLLDANATAENGPIADSGL